jgi:hypothetical protein
MRAASRPPACAMDISDHAVVRWLERVAGVDIRRVREEIQAAVVAGGFEQAPAAGTFIDVPDHRIHLLVRDGQVITVFNYDGEPD